MKETAIYIPDTKITRKDITMLKIFNFNNIYVFTSKIKSENTVYINNDVNILTLLIKKHVIKILIIYKKKYISKKEIYILKKCCCKYKCDVIYVL